MDRGNSIGISGAMFLIFLTLKLTGHITWSWWYVTLPLWGALAFGITILTIIAILFKVSEVNSFSKK